MNILVTGGSGFIGRNLAKALKNNHNVFTPNSKELDLTDSNKVDNYFRTKHFDWVIHCAIKGGRRNIKDSPFTTYDNLKMFFNLMNNRSRFEKLINFTSGADFDRRTDVTSNKNNLFTSFPVDYYGISKNIISRILHNSPHYNFRVFGTFGVDEDDERFIKKSILNAKKGETIIVHQDRFFDYIYIEDLVNVVKYYIDNPKVTLDIDLDLVYYQKVKLSDIAKLIPGFNRIVLQDDTPGKSYTGSIVGIKTDIELIGLEEGIKRVYNAL